MHCHIAGYYGYKNFGDELLLLGVMSRLAEVYQATKITIEAEDTQRLTTWIAKHEHLLQNTFSRQVVQEHSGVDKKALLVLGGGEVITDARNFPFNGRTYLVYYRQQIWTGNYLLIGGIGNVKKIGTSRLYKLLLGRAKNVRVRDEVSYKIVQKYTNRIEQYKDRGVAFLEKIIPTIPLSNKKESSVVINVNSHIWTEETKKILSNFSENYSEATFYFFPGQMGGDDTDEGLYNPVKQYIPSIQLFDWTGYSIEELLIFASSCTHCLAARLHVLLLFDHVDVPLTPLVYQEKITKFFGDKI